MKRLLRLAGAAAVALLIGANSAYAWHLGGYVRCDANGNQAVDDGDLLLAGVNVTVKGISDPTFEVTQATGADGKFQIRVSDLPASIGSIHPSRKVGNKSRTLVGWRDPGQADP